MRRRRQGGAAAGSGQGAAALASDDVPRGIQDPEVKGWLQPSAHASGVPLSRHAGGFREGSLLPSALERPDLSGRPQGLTRRIRPPRSEQMELSGGLKPPPVESCERLFSRPRTASRKVGRAAVLVRTVASTAGEGPAGETR